MTKDINTITKKTNIFQKALTIMSTKNGQDISDDEREIIYTALLPLMMSPKYSDIPIYEGLGNLARMLEGGKMICPFNNNHEPCKYINCPFWSEKHQNCNWAILINELANLLTKNEPMAQLTPKEQQVLELMTQGYSNQQISDAIHLNVSTVKNYVSNILSKLGVKSRVEAVIISLEHRATVRQG